MYEILLLRSYYFYHRGEEGGRQREGRAGDEREEAGAREWVERRERARERGSKRAAG